MRYTPKGSAVCRDLALQSIAITMTDSGKSVKKLLMSMCVLWARLAEIAGEYLKKDGRFSSKAGCKWTPGTTKQTGQKRTRLHYW